MANKRFIDFPIATTVGDNDIILIWQDGANKQTTKATILTGVPDSLNDLTDVTIAGLTNGQILRYNSVSGQWENTDQGNLDLNDLNDVTIVSPSNGQVLVYNSATSKWENSSGGYVPYTGAVTTVNLGAQIIQAGQFVKAGGTSSQFLKADGSVDSTAYGTGSVTSVGLTMPSAFNVANSPVTTAGTLAVTGAGTVGQYIRGDGSLADFPQTSGGGSSVSYYLNGSVSQGTIGGVAYLELNKVPVLGAGTDFTIAADGYIASFITDSGDPNLLEIPAGNWNLETYFSASSSGGTPTFYVELYKVSGATATLIASSSSSPEFIAFGTTLTPYFSTLAVPQTTLALTDRLALRYYVTHSGRTITLHTENNHLCQVITTFTTGLTALNGLTAQVQNLAVGTSGTDFNIASATATHTFNLPTASATNRGALSSADWSTFNAKQNALTLTTTGSSGAATLVGATLNIPNYGSALSGYLPLTGGTLTGPLGVTGNLTLIAGGSGSSFDRQISLGSGTAYSYQAKANGDDFQLIEAGSHVFLEYDYGGSLGTGTIRLYNNTVSTGSFTASSFIRTGGTSSQFLKADGSVDSTSYVPSNRTITINGTTEDLTANRTFNVGTVTSVTASSPLSSSGGTTPNITIQQASGSQSGFLSSTDWTTFNSKTSSQWITSGSNIYYNSGNVLIGTTSDNGSRLQVSGTSTISGDLVLTTGANRILRIYSSSSYYYDLQTVGDDFQIREAGSTPRLTFTYPTGAATFSNLAGSGNRIVVANSSGTLISAVIGSGLAFDGTTLTATGGSSGSISGSGTSGTIALFTGTSSIGNSIITQSGGNVLIGTGTAAARLTVVGATTLIGQTNVSARFSDDNNSTLLISHPAGTSNTATITGNLNLGFATGASGSITEKVRILANGNVLIGTTTDNGERLQVFDTGPINAVAASLFSTSFALKSTLELWNKDNNINLFTKFTEYYTGTSRVQVGAIGFNNSQDRLTIAGYQSGLYFSGSSKFTSLSTGTVYSNNGVLTNTNPSDFNLKENIAPINYGLGEILKLNAVSFNWKNDTINQGKQYGFIAQEVEKIMPDLVKKGEYLGLDKEAIFTTLVKAIQELKQEIDTLKN